MLVIPFSTRSNWWVDESAPEVGRWLGCSTADDGWYGPEGGGRKYVPEEWLDANQEMTIFTMRSI